LAIAHHAIRENCQNIGRFILMLSTMACTGLSSTLTDRRSLDAIINAVLSVAPRENGTDFDVSR
jgi:hypothetical protein